MVESEDETSTGKRKTARSAEQKGLTVSGMEDGEMAGLSQERREGLTKGLMEAGEETAGLTEERRGLITKEVAGLGKVGRKELNTDGAAGRGSRGLNTEEITQSQLSNSAAGGPSHGTAGLTKQAGGKGLLVQELESKECGSGGQFVGVESSDSEMSGMEHFVADSPGVSD